MKPHRGVVILVLGLVCLVACPPLGIVAWVMSSQDLRQMDAGVMDATGRDFTRAGRILGILGTAYFICWVLAVIAFVIFRMIPFFSDRQL